MLILGIESSCDDTAAAVVSFEEGKGLRLLSSAVSSQIEQHTLYGGVVPEIAGRAHAENISGTLTAALKSAEIEPDMIDAVAVTTHPGLIGALLVGVNFAKSFAYSYSKPIVPVNHIKAHTAAVYLIPDPPKPPFISLVVSGGHTSFYVVKDYTVFSEIGGTRDDAAGEAFDKVGRVIGLPYPSGAAMDALAFEGDKRYASSSELQGKGRGKKRTALKRYCPLPSPAMKDGLAFSFSGLKSAALNFINSKRQAGEEPDRELLASDFTFAVSDGISSKVAEALVISGCRTLVLSGGVAANRHLRTALAKTCDRLVVRFCPVPTELCGDNAAMVAAQGCYEFLAGNTADTSLNASASDMLKQSGILL